MRAIAEGLISGASTGAPPIDAGGRWAHDGRLLKDFRGCHNFAGWAKTRFCRLFCVKDFSLRSRRFQG